MPSRDWREGFAERLRKPSYAREFLLGSPLEELPLQEALGEVIRAVGVREFAAKVGMAPSNVSRAINPRHNPTQATLDRLLAPFGLRLSVAPIAKKRGRGRVA